VLVVTCAGFLAVDRLGPLLLALRIAHGIAFTFFSHKLLRWLSGC
jgi:hypothetical protein